MKKKILIALCTVITLIVVTAIVLIINPNNNEEEEMCDRERIAKVMKTTRPTDVFIKGTDVSFSEDEDYKKINQINETELDSEKEYIVIVINDLYNEVELSEDEIEYARELIQKEGYLLIYLGEKYATAWDDLTDGGIANVEGNLYYSFNTENGKVQRKITVFTAEDRDDLKKYPYSLEGTLMYAIEEFLGLVDVI